MTVIKPLQSIIKKRILSIMLALAIIIPMFSLLPLQVSAELDDWTILAYIDADDTSYNYNEDGDKVWGETAFLQEFEELAEVGSKNGDLNIVVQMDRIGMVDSEETDTRYENWADTKRFYIWDPDLNGGPMDPTQGNALSIHPSLGEKNMGDGDTLRDFLVWGIQEYPAQKYMVILTDHGAHWRGILYDDTSNGDLLELDEIEYAFSAAMTERGDKIDLVLFNACNAACIEMAYQISPYVEYMVACESIMANIVFIPNYHGAQAGSQGDIIQMLREGEGPLFSPKEYAISIINRAHISHNADIVGFTAAAFDLTKIQSVVNSINTFAMDLSFDWPPQGAQDRIRSARADTEPLYGPEWGEEDHIVDIYHFASEIIEHLSDYPYTSLVSAQQVIDNLQEGHENFIMNMRYANQLIDNNDEPFVHGISFYFPNNIAQFSEYDQYKQCGRFVTDTVWDEFLAEYHHIELPGPTTTFRVQDGAIPGENGWWRSDVTIILEAHDHSGAGILETNYKFAHSWIEYTVPIDLISGGYGTWTIWYRSVDNIYNYEPVKIQIVRIDFLKPYNPSSHSYTITNNIIEIQWNEGSEGYPWESGVLGYSYVWDQNSNTLPDEVIETTGTSAISASLSEGDWWFHIRTRDIAGNWANDAYHIGPFFINELPVAIITGETQGMVGEDLTFSGLESYDPGGGQISDYIWSFDDGSPPVHGSPVIHAWAIPGIHTVELEVIDDEQSSSTANLGVWIGGIYNLNSEISYQTIKLAIEAANSGDTIIVGPGTYFEDDTIDIDKSITLVGNEGDPGNTIIDFIGSSFGGFRISSNDVEIRGFKITNGFDEITIENHASNCRISDNIIDVTSRNGIVIDDYSSRNIVCDNEIQLPGPSCAGIYLMDASYNIISDNTIIGDNVDDTGIFIDAHSGLDSKFNTISGNYFMNCYDGVSLFRASYNKFFGNVFQLNDVAIDLLGNNLGNVFYWNSFEDSSWAHVLIHYSDRDSPNTWNAPGLGGNYYSGYTVDDNGDGILDPYELYGPGYDANVDYEPLEYPVLDYYDPANPNPVYYPRILNQDKLVRYHTLWNALDEADIGDTIGVDAGIYLEGGIEIDTSVTLKNYYDVDPSNHIIDGTGSSIAAIIVASDDVTIEGFTITNSGGNGILVGTFNSGNIKGCKIMNNIIEANSQHGVKLSGYSSESTINNNEILDNNMGIYLQRSDNNLIIENTIMSSTDEVGIYLDAQGELKSEFNTIIGNVIQGFNSGLYLWNAENNRIFGNTIQNNDYGIDMRGGSTNNEIYYNNFMSNSDHVYFDSTTGRRSYNCWNSAFGGNYWSGYSVDDDGDGILDPYYLFHHSSDMNVDEYPLSCQAEPIFLNEGEDCYSDWRSVSGQFYEIDTVTYTPPQSIILPHQMQIYHPIDQFIPGEEYIFTVSYYSTPGIYLEILLAYPLSGLPLLYYNYGSVTSGLYIFTTQGPQLIQVVNTNTWQSIEMNIYHAGTHGEVTLQLNGVLIGTYDVPVPAISGQYIYIELANGYTFIDHVNLYRLNDFL